MENVCPVDEQINNDDRSFWLVIITGEILKQVAKMKPEKHIMGRIVISTKVCPIFKTCSLKNSSETSSTTYIFHTDKSLRVYVTLVHFELITCEKVELINGNRCLRIPKYSLFIYPNCFQV